MRRERKTTVGNEFRPERLLRFPTWVLEQQPGFTRLGYVLSCFGTLPRVGERLATFCFWASSVLSNYRTQSAYHSVRNSLQEYTALVDQQCAEKEAMRDVLALCRADMHADTQALQKALDALKPTVTAVQLLQIDQPHESVSPPIDPEHAAALAQQLTNYPVLPDRDNLLVTDVEQVIDERNEHHKQVKIAVIAYLETLYAFKNGDAAGASQFVTTLTCFSR